MNLSCPAFAFASALIVAASALQASVITPPVRTFPAPDITIATKMDVSEFSITTAFATTCESSAMPFCGITGSTANWHRLTDLPACDLLVEMAGGEISDGAFPWLQILPVVIEVSVPTTAPAGIRDPGWTVPVLASNTLGMAMFAGDLPR